MTTMRNPNEKTLRPVPEPPALGDDLLSKVSGGSKHPVYPMPPGQFPGEGNGWLPGNGERSR
jgi:hypothetical protein